MEIIRRRRWRRAIARLGATALGVAAASLASAPSALAQTRAPATSSSVGSRLGDLYSQVLHRNPRVEAARQLARATQARIPGSRRPPDPQLQLGFMNYTLPGLAPMPTLGMTQIQLMQMVPLGGKLGLSGRVAGAQAAATGERAADVVWELRNQTAMAFYDLYATDRQLDVARETLRLLKDAALTAESMYRVGQGRQADVLRAQVEIARMAEDTLRMTAMRETMVARLNALTNRDATTAVPTPTLPAFPATLPDRASLDSIALDTRPMIRAALEEVRAADASAALARRELIPDLQVGVQYAQRAATMTPVDANGAPMSERTTERMGSLMLGITVPIFARDRQLRMRSEANAMKAMAEADVAAMRVETRGRIGEAYAALMRARNLATLFRTTVLPQAEATVSSAMSAYRSGSVDFMTLLDDRMTVNKYRQELSVLEADEGKAWAELEMLTGRELLEATAIGGVTNTATLSPTQAVVQATRGVQ